MAPSGISINKPAAIAIIVLVAGGITFYQLGWLNFRLGAGAGAKAPIGEKADTKPPAVGSPSGGSGCFCLYVYQGLHGL